MNSDIELYEKFKCKIIGYEEIYKGFSKEMENLKNKNGFDFLRLYLSGVAKDLLDISVPSKIQDKHIPYNVIKLLEGK